MKQVSVREFQLHAEKYLKELPILLTRYNLPVALINPPDDKTTAFQELKEEFGEPVQPDEPVYSKEDL